MSDVNSNFLQIVHDPPQSEIDIVAVHGLHPFGSGSNSFSTWTARQGEERRNWLSHAEFLPKELPTARIMIFSYNSNAVFQASRAVITDHSRNLLERLRQKRSNNAPNRPLMFICHSLGGLLVKEALFQAYYSNETHREVIYNCTKGIVFFGTPQKGGENVVIGNLVANVVRACTGGLDNKYMEVLKGDTLFSDVTRDFFESRGHDMNYISFIETRKTKGTMVVLRENSVLGLPNEQQIPLDTDHAHMCKIWDPQGGIWFQVKEPICRMAKDAISLTP
ncbi:hypothetical protein B0T10DRAFT_607608 [Thelonectria olida]|uniref:DUF676 domain-containing protein n=1 Tax=Thelonectria olida TaxID=1576542 RepID=A0A9P8W4G2_9HYPO|nr:hypothetical protein B0T10DRAFT_607608 [Thelonectria olida]